MVFNMLRNNEGKCGVKMGQSGCRAQTSGPVGGTQAGSREETPVSKVVKWNLNIDRFKFKFAGMFGLTVL